jgi:hypothetical protein
MAPPRASLIPRASLRSRTARSRLEMVWSRAIPSCLLNARSHTPARLQRRLARRDIEMFGERAGGAMLLGRPG